MLEAFQVHPNASVDVDGEGRVVSTDASLTSVSRNGGKVDWYETEWLTENGSPVEQKPADTAGPTSAPVEPSKTTPAPEATPTPDATAPAPSGPETGTRQES